MKVNSYWLFKAHCGLWGYCLCAAMYSGIKVAAHGEWGDLIFMVLNGVMSYWNYRMAFKGLSFEILYRGEVLERYKDTTK